MPFVLHQKQAKELAAGFHDLIPAFVREHADEFREYLQRKNFTIE